VQESFGMNNTTTKATSAATVASDVREMMAAWDKIKAAAVAQYPGATDEQIYALTSGAMKHALGMR
jgi:hypothetical protein